MVKEMIGYTTVLPSSKNQIIIWTPFILVAGCFRAYQSYLTEIYNVDQSEKILEE